EDLRPARRGEPAPEGRSRAGLRSGARGGGRDAEGAEAPPSRTGPVRRRPRRGGGVAMNSLRAKRLRLFALGLVVWSAFGVGRLVELQIVQGPRYRARAQRQQERRIEVAGRRGPILDRQGRQLAVSVEVSSVYAIADEVEDARSTGAALSPVLGQPGP